MKEKYKSLLKDTGIFAVGSLGSKLILFFLVPLYTNYLTTDEYGIAELVNSFSQILMPVTSLVISNALIRFGMMRDKNKEDVAVSAFFVLGFSAVFTIILIPVLKLYKPIEPWVYYLIILVILSNFSEVQRTYLKVINKNHIFSLISIIQTLVLAITNIILLAFIHAGVQGYLLSNIIAVACATVLSFFLSGLKFDLRKGNLDWKLLKDMVSFSTPLIFSNISWWLIHSSDKVMLEWMVSASALGIYTVATKIPSLINVIIGIFNQAWGISSIKEIETTKDMDYYSSVFNVFSTLLFGVCIVLNCFIKPFMGIYVSSSFSEAWIYTPLLLAAAVFYSISAFIGTIYSALQKTKNDMWTTFVCAIVNLLVNYFGIKYFGIWGAIAGTISAYLVIAIIRIFDIKRLIHLNITFRFIISSFIVILQAILVSLNLNVLMISILALLLFNIINISYLKSLFNGLINN